jgi:hypothetical protein
MTDGSELPAQNETRKILSTCWLVFGRCCRYRLPTFRPSLLLNTDDVSEDLSTSRTELALASGSQLPVCPSKIVTCAEPHFYDLPLIRPSGFVNSAALLAINQSSTINNPTSAFCSGRINKYDNDFPKACSQRVCCVGRWRRQTALRPRLAVNSILERQQLLLFSQFGQPDIAGSPRLKTILSWATESSRVARAKFSIDSRALWKW